jgi:CBS domain-containing protein
VVQLPEIMATDVFTVAPDGPVAGAAAAMVNRRIGSARRNDDPELTAEATRDQLVV